MEWLDSGDSRTLPILPYQSQSDDAMLLLPGQTGWVGLTPESEAIFESAQASHHSCLGMPATGGNVGLVSVLEFVEEQPRAVADSSRVLVRCVGRAHAQPGRQFAGRLAMPV